MATINAPGNLCTSQTGTGDSQNVIADSGYAIPRAIRITSTVGSTPTVTVNIQGSIDGVVWFNIPYALVGAPSTWVLTAITITTATTVNYLLQPNQAWHFAKLVLSANTNVTLTADYS